MRKNFGPKPYMYPMPVLILASYNEDKSANAMNAAWGGIIDSDMILISISGKHKTTKNIKRTNAFSVSFATKDHVIACDYVGIVSGNKEENKFEKAGFSASESTFVNAPIINELPLTLECEVAEWIEDGSDYLLKGKIINVSCDTSILTDEKIDLTKFKPITYDPANHTYIALGEKVGNAFSDGKKINTKENE